MSRGVERLAWVHVGVAGLAVALCAAVWLWAAERSDAERRQAIRQSTVLAETLTAAYAGQLRDRLGMSAPRAGVPAALGNIRLAVDCAFCVVSWRDPAGVADLAPLLRSMAQAGPGPAVMAALVFPDGLVRAVHADGAVTSQRLQLSSAIDIMQAPRVLNQRELGSPAMAMAMVPLSPELAVAIGIDLASTLAKEQRRRREDETWALGTMLLLLVAAGGASTLVEWVVRRHRRLSHDQVALRLANAELKHARDQARADSFKLQTIFTSMSDGVSHFDRHLRLVQWNQRFPELSGVPREVLRAGMPLEEVLRAQADVGEFGAFETEEARDAAVARRLEVVRTTTPKHVIERPRPDGRVVELRRTSLTGGGFVTLYTDITTRKQVEAVREMARAQAEQSAAEKARFVSIVSHEIRMPLNVTLNALGLIDREALPPAQRSLVDTGLQAGDALLALLNDILDLSRLEAGQLSISPGPFAIRPLVEGVADMYRQMALERRIDIQVEIGPRLPERLYGDAGRLRQMLMNLVGNAAKFSGPGTVHIRADVSGSDVAGAEAQRLRLAVLDCGPVIADEDRNRLFRPFSQLNRPLHDPSTGSGLGLAICSMLAARMGGSIGCDTGCAPECGDGNEFWIELPLEPAAASPERAQPAGTGPGARVLVVEDLVANQTLLAAMLGSDGHVVDIAGSGADALQALAQRRYDLVLMDMLMPGMDGLEATRSIRAMGGPLSALPIVGVTGNTSSEARSACLAAGMSCVLTKPIEAAALADAMQRHMWGGEGGTEKVRASAPPKVLDGDRLGDLPGVDALLSACLDDLRGQLLALDDATRRGDVTALQSTAHAMSGAAGNHGFECLDRRLRSLMTVTAIDVTVAGSVESVAREIDVAQEAATALRLAHAV